MLGIGATIEGDKVWISNLGEFAREVPRAVSDGLTEIVKEAHYEAVKNLSGPGRTNVRMRDKRTVRMQDGNFSYKYKRKTARRGQSSDLGARPGSYPPVPKLTGNLARLEDYVLPGRIRTSNGVTFSAGKLEAILFNSAEYSRVIHDPKKGESSYTYGRRPFQDDAVKEINIVSIMEAALSRSIKNSGLS